MISVLLKVHVSFLSNLWIQNFEERRLLTVFHQITIVGECIRISPQSDKIYSLVGNITVRKAISSIASIYFNPEIVEVRLSVGAMGSHIMDANWTEKSVRFIQIY